MAAPATARRAAAAQPAPARRGPAPVRRPRSTPSRRPTVRSRAAALPRPRPSMLLDALLRGRGWIAIVFVLLAGIVFFNVDLLRLNRGIAVTAENASTVKRENARLRGEVARLGSSERIQRVAAERGLVLPAPGEVRYRKANPDIDARNAVRRLEQGGGATATTTPAPTELEAPANSATAPPEAATAPQATTGTTTPSTGATETLAAPETQDPATTAPEQSAPDAGATGAAVTGGE